MLSRTLLLAVLASPMFVPVTCTSVMLPVAHALSYAQVRDLRAGERPWRSPLQVPVVDRLDPRMSIALDLAELPAALERWPGLSPRLPPQGHTAGRGRERLRWRVLEDSPAGQRIELVSEGAGPRHTLHYRAGEGGVVLLSSREFAGRHAWSGFAAGLVCALALMAVMRRRRTGARPPA